MTDDQARLLIRKYLAAECTDAERTLVEQYFNDDLRNRTGMPGYERMEQVDRRLMRALVHHIRKHEQPGGVRIHRLARKLLPYAAAILLVASVVGYFTVVRQKPSVGRLAATEILPGGNRAVLTLADGRTIDLSEAQDGIVVGDDIRYQDGTEVFSPEVQKTGSQEDSQHAELTTKDLRLTTSKGSTYQVTLPDGTRVWLNASSTLRYPSRFADGERLVEIVGEGYFSVAKDTRKPFKVVSSGQVVEVLGTEFNISAYPDDSNTKTTLMSGSVRVAFSGNMEKELVPGQQSVLRGTVMEVRQVETGPYTAWKEGRFVFEGKTFTEIMRELARWYDIDIHYEGEIPEVEFYGDAFRNDNLAIVLAMLESASIDYELKPGRKLMISGKKGGR